MKTIPLPIKNSATVHFSLLFTVLLLFLGVSHASEKSERDKTNKKAVLTVAVTQPQPVTVTETVEANGSIEAREIVAVDAQVSGLALHKILVDVGDVVKEGQLLAEYDLTPVSIDIAQAQAQLKQARVAYQQASANARRAKKLRNSKAISDIEKENFLFQQQKAQARFEAAQATLKNQQLRANYAQVRAKVAGVITDKQATLGAIGNPGTPLFSIIANNELEWHALIPSRSLSTIVNTMPVIVTIPTNTGNIAVNGFVRNIAPTVDSQTHLGTVYVSLHNHPLLRRGLFVKGRFDVGRKTVLSLPSSSLLRRDGYSYVFVVDSNNQVEKRKIQLENANSTNQSVLVAGGLSNSDRVVKDGVGFLKNGDNVNVVESK